MIKYFFCSSYQAFLLAIHFNTKQRDLIIITSNYDIGKACEFLKIEYIQIPSYKIKELIFKSNNVKRMINQLRLRIGTSEIGFTHRQFAYDCFILINEILRNGGKASFFDFEIIYTDEPSFKINGVNCIKTLLFRIIIETIYKVSLKTVSFGNTVTNAIGEKFFCEHKKNNLIVNEIRREYYDIVFTLSKTFHLDTVNYQHVFIDQSFPNDSIIDNIKLNSIKKFLFEINNLSIKPHPGHKHSNIYNNERIIPEFIPAELIFNNIECSIISIYSSVLFSASKIPGLRIISILPIVVKTDHDYTLYKDILIEKTNNRIELIYDIDDLLSILTRLQHRL